MDRGFVMPDYTIRKYRYRCSCGYELKVIIDYGVPQQAVSCRKCSKPIQRDIE